ncbi:prolyl oligopeptidase family protein [soil metagenome]
MTLRYPPTATVEVTDDYHGTAVADPYRWLEDTDAPGTRAWIGAQQRLTSQWLSSVAARDELRARLTALWDHPRRSAPWRRGTRWFQLRNSGLQSQQVLWTMPAADAHGVVLLDPNTWSDDGTTALSGLAISGDGTWLAYARSDRGSDWMTWRVRHLDEDADRPDVVAWSKFAGAAWAPDASGFYYGAYDPPDDGHAYQEVNRNQRLYFHGVGDDQSADAVVYARPDEPEWGFHPWVSDDGRWLVVTVSHGTDPRNRLYIADLQGECERSEPVGGDLQGEVTPLLDAFDAKYACIGTVDRRLFVLTDRDAPTRRIVAIDIDTPDPQHWVEIVPAGDDTIEHAQLIGGRIVVVRLHHASHQLSVHGLDGAPLGAIPVGEYGSLAGLTGRPDDPQVHVAWSTFTQPTRVLSHDLDTGVTAEVFAADLVDRRDDLVTTQVFVPATDGARVPMFLVHRADVTPDRDRGEGERSEPAGGDLGATPAPTILYGYGGFGIPLTPAFSVSRMVWVERGGVLVVANLRGGGEYGTAWHDGGRLDNKQQVFDDAITCAGWLVDNGWTTPAQLAIQGGSNGGLLVGACITQRPDLFAAAVAEVGVFDMLRFHRFTIGWAWTSDYGDPDDAEQFATLHAYSPLHRVKDGFEYPATLIVTGDHDDRVVPGHSFKFAATLQAAQAGSAPILLRVETSAGHGAGKPTAKLINERADILAFCDDVLTDRRAADVRTAEESDTR